MQRFFTWSMISAVICLTSGTCKFIMVLFINRNISAFLFLVFFSFLLLLFIAPSVANSEIVHANHAFGIYYPMVAEFLACATISCAFLCKV